MLEKIKLFFTGFGITAMTCTLLAIIGYVAVLLTGVIGSLLKELFLRLAVDTGTATILVVILFASIAGGIFNLTTKNKIE